MTRTPTWIVAAAAALLAATAAPAQVVPAYAQIILDGKSVPGTDSNVVQAGCASCGGLPAPALGGGGGCATCGGDGGCMCQEGCQTCNCKPGKKKCDLGCGDTFLNKCFGGLFGCLCCPDACYDPVWEPAANAAFWVDAARPKSQIRIGYNAGLSAGLVDRGESYFAKFGRRGPQQFVTGFDAHELSVYTEAAGGAGSAFVEIPYRSLTGAGLTAAGGQLVPRDFNEAGFADMNVGTKAMLLDCELLQFTFQFKTYIPIGSTNQGLGTGHVSLEPSFLAALKISPSCYLQAQVSEWIPLGGDEEHSGAILHYHFALNKECYKSPGLRFITTLEANGYSFQDGQVTFGATANGDTLNFSRTKASGESYFSAGPGFRLVICDNYDVGVGSAFSLSEDHYFNQQYRAEVRFRY